MKRLKKENINDMLLGLCIISIAITLVICWINQRVGFHSDVASCINYAVEMIRQNSLLPENWVGSTGILVLAYPIYFFLHFTSDYMTAYAMARIVMVGILLLSVFYTCNTFFDKKSWRVCVPLLFTCYEATHYDMLIISCAYTAAVSISLLSVSSVTRLYVVDKPSAKMMPKMVIALVSVFLSSLLGIQQMQATVLPIIGALVISYLIEYWNVEIDTGFRKMKSLLSLLIPIAIVSGMGFYLSRILFEKMGIPDQSGRMVFAGTIDGIMANLQGLVGEFMTYFSFPFGQDLFSVNGIFKLALMTGGIMITIVVPILSYAEFRQKSKKQQIFMIFTLLHVIEILIIAVGMGQYARRYLLTSIVLLIFISGEYIHTHWFKEVNFGTMILSIIVVLYVNCGLYVIYDHYQLAQNGKEVTDNLEGFLESENLDYGYASFWNAGKTTALSNGKVQVNSINVLENMIEPHYYLGSMDWYDPDYHVGKTFLLLTNDELAVYAPEGLEKTQIGAPAEILNYEGYTVLVYDWNISLNEFDGRADGNTNYIYSAMKVSDPAMVQSDGTIRVQKGQVMYGPYITLESGRYEVAMKLESTQEARLKITAESGVELLYEGACTGPEVKQEFVISQRTKNVEFLIENNCDSPVIVQSVLLNKIDE